MATKTQPKPKTELQNVAGNDALVLQTSHGETHIQPHVVAKIAGLAIREVEGVHNLVAFGTGQTLSKMANSIRGGDLRELGVSVEVGKVEAAVDCRIVTHYGVSIPDVAQKVREGVTHRISHMTGLVVKEVNVEVVDLHFAEDHGPVLTESRVQ